jgi:hypothetical protein
MLNLSYGFPHCLISVLLAVVGFSLLHGCVSLVVSQFQWQILVFPFFLLRVLQPVSASGFCFLCRCSRFSLTRVPAGFNPRELISCLQATRGSPQFRPLCWSHRAKTPPSLGLARVEVSLLRAVFFSLGHLFLAATGSKLCWFASPSRLLSGTEGLLWVWAHLRMNGCSSSAVVLSLLLWCIGLSICFVLSRNCYREILVYLLSHRIKRLEDSWFKLFFHGDFLNTSTRCSVKCLWGHKLSFDLIFIIDLACVLASTVSYFRCGS